MYRLLLIDQDAIHAERLAKVLRQRGLTVVIAEGFEEAARRLRQRVPTDELVVVVESGVSEEWPEMLRKLVHASRQLSSCSGPLFLFVARRKCSSNLRLRIERLGVRYVRER